jgi:hypothetical protein
MNKFVSRAMILASLGLSAPAASAVNGFAIVNQAGGALSDVALRRVGDRAWQPLSVALAAGASARADFKNDDCAFDLRATVAGVGPIVWNGVNLCDVKRVTLNRVSSGRQWVDYD